MVYVISYRNVTGEPSIQSKCSGYLRWGASFRFFVFVYLLIFIYYLYHHRHDNDDDDDDDDILYSYVVVKPNFRKVCSVSVCYVYGCKCVCVRACVRA